jgi:hypothetical protein
VAVCLGYPLIAVALFAYSSFSGCFISCSAPSPGAGLLWSAFTAVLLLAPIAVGLAVAGARSRRVWFGALVVVLVAVTVWDVLAVLA